MRGSSRAMSPRGDGFRRVQEGEEELSYIDKIEMNVKLPEEQSQADVWEKGGKREGLFVATHPLTL